MPKDGDESSGCNPWSAFTADNGPLLHTGAETGRLFDNTAVRPASAWYPLSGRRNYLSGTFTALPNSGYCYSSTALPQSKAYYLGLYASFVNAWAGTGLNGRAEAFPVRCIRE